VSVKHAIRGERRDTLAERVFWRCNATSNDPASPSYNAVYNVYCTCGAAGGIQNSLPGYREVAQLRLWNPKGAGPCDVILDALRRELPKALALPDDNAFATDEEETRLFEEGRRIVYERHHRTERHEGPSSS
jgi:hypothetical protein